MIVEFVGCTGAGKTTLISDIQRRLAGHAQAVTAYEVIAAPIGLGQVTNPTLRNLIQDIVGLPFFVGSLYRHRAFVFSVLKILASHESYNLFTVNYLRSIMRKIGTYEIVRRYDGGRIILVDEGTILSAHLLFVFTGSGYPQGEIEKFASLVPLPDLVVYVRAPVEDLVQRSLQRSSPPKEMRRENLTTVETYIRRAVQMFDQLSEITRIRERTVTVTNADFVRGKREATAEYLATLILNHAPRGKQTYATPATHQAPFSSVGDKHVS